MSTRDRYTKIIESLVNGDEATASDLLHEAFVDQAREIWNDLVEADDVIEDELSEEDLEEAIGDEEADDFLDDIESDEDEIEAEEMYGESDEDEMDDLEATDELSDVDDEESDMDFDGDGEMDDHEEEHADIEDKMMDVEDALEDLKKTFAELMGAGGEEEADDADEEPELDSLELATEADEAEEEDTLEEAAELKKVGKDGMHPADMPAGDDGKASPVAGKNDMGGETIKTGAKGSEGSSKGLSDEAPKDMNVTHPGDGAKLSPESRGHGAEKKGKAE